jgi:transposase
VACWTSDQPLRFHRSVERNPPTVAAPAPSPVDPIRAARPDCPGCQVLAAQVRELLARVEQLEARLNQNSANSSRPPSSDGPAAAKPKPREKPAGRRRGGQPGHRGAKRDLKPLECVAEVVEAVPTHCAHCQRPLPAGQAETDPPPRRHQVTELPPIVCVTTEYRLHARTCPTCRRRTWADWPADVPRGAHGPRFQAVCSLLTGGYGLSRRATQELVRDFLGEDLSLGTLASLEAATAAALSGPYQEVADAVADAARVNADETRWFEAHRLAWLWLAATETLALFRIDQARSREAFERLLPPQGAGPRRTVTSDRYSAYCHLVGAEWQICWSHLKREFIGWTESTGKAAVLGKVALAATRRVFDRWHQYRAGELPYASLAASLEPVKARLRRVLEDAAQSRHWRVEGPGRHLLKHFDSLWTFARVEGVEPTNNHAERTLRRGVLWRKRSFGHQSESGRAFVERLLTAVSSLRLQGRGVLAYLEDACRAALIGSRPSSLLPHLAGSSP